MAPTLADQDRLIVNKLAYRLADPQRSDIVMLYYPLNPDKSFVKRVIAEEGDTVRIVDGRVYVNDVPLRDDYVPPEYRSHDDWGPQVIPEGYYFVMGDHRNNSSDSRHWGFVPEALHHRQGAASLVAGAERARVLNVQVQSKFKVQGQRFACASSRLSGLQLSRLSHWELVRTLNFAPSQLTVDRYAAVSRVLRRVLLLNLIVAVAKIALGLVTGAVSVLSDGFHSLTDSASNVVALVGVRIAQPAAGRRPSVRASQVRDDGVGRHPAVPAARPGADPVGGGRAAFARRRRPPIEALTFVVMGATFAVNLARRPYERRAGQALVQRGAAGRRAPHAKRPADVGHRHRRAGRRAPGLSAPRSGRGAHRRRRSSPMRAGRSSRTRRGSSPTRSSLPPDDLRDVVLRRAGGARLPSDPLARLGRSRLRRPAYLDGSGDAARRGPSRLARRQGPDHGALPADQGRGHSYRAAAQERRTKNED